MVHNSEKLDTIQMSTRRVGNETMAYPHLEIPAAPENDFIQKYFMSQKTDHDIVQSSFFKKQIATLKS